MEHDKDGELQQLTEVTSLSEAQVLRGLLASFGIQAHIARGRGVAAPDSFDLLPVPLHPFEEKSPLVRIMVLGRDLEAAQQILSENCSG